MAPIVLADEEWDAQFDTLLSKFQDLFNNATNAPELGSTVKSIVDAHQTSACVEALASALIHSAESSPKSIDAFVQAVSSLRPHFDEITVDFAGSEDKFSDVFDIRFLDLLNTTLSGLQLQEPASLRESVEPSNPTLTSALLSGSCIQHGLIEKSSSVYRFVYGKALQLDQQASSQKTTTTKRGQVNVVAAGLMLAVAGQKMMAGELGQLYDKEAVVRALKEKEGQVENVKGKELLQEITVNAEKNFAKAYTTEEVWNKLFE